MVFLVNSPLPKYRHNRPIRSHFQTTARHRTGSGAVAASGPGAGLSPSPVTSAALRPPGSISSLRKNRRPLESPGPGLGRPFKARVTQGPEVMSVETYPPSLPEPAPLVPGGGKGQHVGGRRPGEDHSPIDHQLAVHPRPSFYPPPAPIPTPASVSPSVQGNLL